MNYLIRLRQMGLLVTRADHAPRKWKRKQNPKQEKREAWVSMRRHKFHPKAWRLTPAGRMCRWKNRVYAINHGGAR